MPRWAAPVFNRYYAIADKQSHGALATDLVIAGGCTPVSPGQPQLVDIIDDHDCPLDERA